MTQLRRILFPIDFSKACVAMAPSVREMAQRFRASVTVLNAFNAVPEYIYGPSLDDPSYAEEGPIPYTPALLELRHRQVRRLEEFSCTYLSGLTEEKHLKTAIRRG